MNHWDTEAQVVRSSLLPAVVGSALLHLVIGSAFILRPFSAPDQTPTTTRPALRVTLVAPKAPQGPNEGDSVVQAADGSGPRQSPATKTTVETIPEIAQELVDARESMRTEPALQKTQTVDPPAAEGDESGEQVTSAAVFEADQLQSAIGAYMASYKSGLVEEWVETCGHRRGRRAGEDPCPGESAEDSTAPAARLFDLSARPVANHKRDRQLLVAESQYLETLVAEDSILGAVARQRYALVKEQYCFLYGCSPRGHNEPEGEVVELISVGSGP